MSTLQEHPLNLLRPIGQPYRGEVPTKPGEIVCHIDVKDSYGIFIGIGHDALMGVVLWSRYSANIMDEAIARMRSEIVEYEDAEILRILRGT